MSERPYCAKDHMTGDAISAGKIGESANPDSKRFQLTGRQSNCSDLSAPDSCSATGSL